MGLRIDAAEQAWPHPQFYVESCLRDMSSCCTPPVADPDNNRRPGTVAEVGSSLGTLDGSELGFELGKELGPTLGLPDGIVVGLVLGTLLGPEVGSEVGKIVGIDDGISLG